MKILRLTCIVFVVLGAFFLFARRDSRFDTLPFPGAGLTVKMLAEVRKEGDYKIQASLSKADQAIGLSPENIPCSLTVTIARDGKPPVKSEITSLHRYGEHGFARIQYYGGGGWHLSPGDYTIEISSREDCRAAMSRGATLSLEQQTTHATERFQVSVLEYWSGLVLLCAGLLGIIFFEFKKT